MPQRDQKKVPDPQHERLDTAGGDKFAEQSDTSRGDNGPVPYDDLEEQELMAKAAERGVEGYQQMGRDELLRALDSPDTQHSLRQSAEHEQRQTQ